MHAITTGSRSVPYSTRHALVAMQVADMLTGDSALPEATPLVPDVATADGAGSPLENQEVLYVSAEESIEQVSSSFLNEKASPASVSGAQNPFRCISMQWVGLICSTIAKGRSLDIGCRLNGDWLCTTGRQAWG